MRIVWMIMLACLPSSFVYGQDYLWNYTSLTGKINQKSSLSFAQKMHYNVDNEKIDTQVTDFIYYRDFIKNITLGAALRNINSYSGSNDNWVSITTPLAYVIYKSEIKNFDISSLNRVGYRFHDNNRFRFRNKTKVLAPSLFKFGFRPYLAEDIFVKLSNDGLYSFRMYTGAYLFQLKFVTIDLLYCRNLSKNSYKWSQSDIAGLYLYFKI